MGYFDWIEKDFKIKDNYRHGVKILNNAETISDLLAGLFLVLSTPFYVLFLLAMAILSIPIYILVAFASLGSDENKR